MQITVLSISGCRRILCPDFEKKRQHFESRTFFYVQILTKTSKNFQTDVFFFQKQCTKSLTCVDNFDTDLTKIRFKGKNSNIRVKGMLI